MRFGYIPWIWGTGHICPRQYPIPHPLQKTVYRLKYLPPPSLLAMTPSPCPAAVMHTHVHVQIRLTNVQTHVCTLAHNKTHKPNHQSREYFAVNCSVSQRFDTPTYIYMYTYLIQYARVYNLDLWLDSYITHVCAIWVVICLYLVHQPTRWSPARADSSVDVLLSQVRADLSSQDKILSFEAHGDSSLNTLRINSFSASVLLSESTSPGK